MLKELYKQRRRAMIKGLVFLLLIPSPGLAIENFAQAKKIDRQIEKEVMGYDEKLVVCPAMKKEET